MKKMRKIFAVLLTLAMVLGMSMTSFAAETTAPSAADKATITVTGIENGATVKAYRIVEPQYNEHGLYGYKVVSPYSIADTINFTPTFNEITTIAKQVSGTAIDLTGNLTNGYTATVGAPSISFNNSRALRKCCSRCSSTQVTLPCQVPFC